MLEKKRRNDRFKAHDECEPEGKQLQTDSKIDNQMRPDNRHTTLSQLNTQPFDIWRDYLPYNIQSPSVNT